MTSKYKDSLTNIGIPIIKTRLSQDRLIFIIGTHTWKDDLYIRRGPGTAICYEISVYIPHIYAPPPLPPHVTGRTTELK